MEMPQPADKVATSSGDERPDGSLIQKGLIVTSISVIFFAGVSLFYAAPSTPPGPPTIISTFPAEGSVVAAGPYTLKVTFDRPMAAGSFSFVRASPETYPQCDSEPKQSSDSRSFTMACIAKPNRRYEIWFNRGRFMNFKSKDGLVPASPKRIIFRAR